MAQRQPRDRSEVSLCSKYFIFFFNFIFLVVSPLALGFGIYIAVLKEKKVTTAVDILLDPSIYLLVFGICGTFMSFLGCLGALREITGVLRVYYWCINFFLLVQLLFVVFAFIFAFSPDTLKQLGIYPDDLLKDAVVRYRLDPDMEDFIDNVQEDMGCCGYSNTASGYKDWDNNEYFNCTEGNQSFEKCGVPWSCCKFEEGKTINLKCGGDTLRDGSTTLSNINQSGCLYVLRNYLIENIVVIAGGVIACFIAEIVLIHLSRGMRDSILIQKMKWQQ